MLFFSLSYNSVKLLKLNKLWLLNYLSEAAETGLTEGLIRNGESVNQEGLVEQLGNFLRDLKIKDKECAFILHDERAYILRLALPDTSDGRVISEAIKERVSLIIPEPLESLETTYKTLDGSKQGGEVQIAAVNRELLNKYLAVFQELGFRPRLVVPESYAFFSLISPFITEGETIIYLDPEFKAANAIIMDKDGVIETFVEQDLEKIRRFALEKWGRKIERVFGPANLSELLKIYPIPLRFKFEPDQITDFASLLGLALLTRQQKPLNLLG